ncbi:uncharacterized protein BKCO1_9800011 [Diplodia corticola]|uniref:Uncharacterized protein n=1 Tax=Diplodia corticola TaxID=236234 RepID=A0A1J9RN15_9PEZI|nr:uncharacterized protein BKCO1_9800011 [Diplodia corticola]OJD28997.1 hypothetical protein BKCO1_9800011 [Diplodia corticola]
MPPQRDGSAPLRSINDIVMSFAYALWPAASRIRIRHYTGGGKRWCSMGVDFEHYPRSNIYWSAPAVPFATGPGTDAYEQLFLKMIKAYSKAKEELDQGFVGSLGARCAIHLMSQHSDEDEDNKENEDESEHKSQSEAENEAAGAAI